MKQEECLSYAAQCDHMAASSRDAELRERLLDLADRWRELSGIAGPETHPVD